MLLTPNHHSREFYLVQVLMAAWVAAVHQSVCRDCDCRFAFPDLWEKDAMVAMILMRDMSTLLMMIKDC